MNLLKIVCETQPRPGIRSALKRLHGLRTEASIRIFSGEKEVSRSQGEILFTDYGLSGPPVLDVSREALRSLANGPVHGSLNLFPEFSPQGLKAMLSERWAARSGRPLRDFFTGMFPAQLAGVLTGLAAVLRESRGGRLSLSAACAMAATAAVLAVLAFV